MHFLAAFLAAIAGNLIYHLIISPLFKKWRTRVLKRRLEQKLIENGQIIILEMDTKRRGKK